MDPDFWHNKWKTGDLFFHKGEPNPLLVKHFSLPAKGHVIVPLCGKSVDMVWLAKLGHQVTGIELSPIASEDFFAENDLTFKKSTFGPHTLYQSEQISIWCGDIFKIPSQAWEGCASVYDRAALIALPKDLRKKYADLICRQLIKNKSTFNNMLLISVEYAQGAVQGPPFSVPFEEIREIFGNVLKVERLDPTDDDRLTGMSPQFQTTEVISKPYRLIP
jgi:thiopurine S-methyltransferase